MALTPALSRGGEGERFGPLPPLRGRAGVGGALQSNPGRMLRTPPMPKTPTLRVDGAVSRPLELNFDDLGALPESDQVRDVSRFQPSRKGDGVTLEALLRLAGPTAEA